MTAQRASLDACIDTGVISVNASHMAWSSCRSLTTPSDLIPTGMKK